MITTPKHGWVIVSASSADPVDLDAWLSALAPRFQGVVTLGAGRVGHGARDGGSLVDRGSALAQLLAGLRRVPHEVALVTFVDAETLRTRGTNVVAEVVDALDEDDAAVVRGVPVTDALKRVTGVMVREPVDRQGLLMPRPPQAIRRAALAEALGSAPEEALDDPAVLLIAAGHRVRVLRDRPSAQSGRPRGL